MLENVLDPLSCMGKSEAQVFLVTQDGRGEYGGKESTNVQDPPWGTQAASGSAHGGFCWQSETNLKGSL